MTVLVNPLEDVPAHFRALMPPFLDVSARLGRLTAEKSVAVASLPWSDDFAAFVISECLRHFDEEIRTEMPDLPEFVVTAMHRQLVATLSNRLDEIYASAGNASLGGSA